jgi:hypothetical protein
MSLRYFYNRFSNFELHTHTHTHITFLITRSACMLPTLPPSSSFLGLLCYGTDDATLGRTDFGQKDTGISEIVTFV